MNHVALSTPISLTGLLSVVLKLTEHPGFPLVADVESDVDFHETFCCLEIGRLFLVRLNDSLGLTMMSVPDFKTWVEFQPLMLYVFKSSNTWHGPIPATATGLFPGASC